MTADLMILNARVLTMDDGAPRAGALAVQGNRILAVGDAATIAALAGPQTRSMDAQGATLLPGFVESHLHLFSGAWGQTMLQLAEVQGADAMHVCVGVFAAARPDGGCCSPKGPITKFLVPAPDWTGMPWTRCATTVPLRSWPMISTPFCQYCRPARRRAVAWP